MRTTKGGSPCDGLPLRRAAIALARRDRARGLADHIEHHVRLRQHGHMARRDLGRGGFHAFRNEALQIGMNRVVLGGEDIPARLCLPRRTFDLLIEQVRHRRPLCRMHQLLLRLGQVSRKVRHAALFEPHATIRHLDVREHGGSRELVKQALRGLVGIRREGRDALGGAAARAGDPGRRVFGNRAIANVALQSQFGQARFRGAFAGSVWPWWRGGVALGWFGPLFWPYAYYDLFDYVYWPYAYDDFWPYAYDDVYYGIYGPYAYSGPYGYRSYADPNGYYGGRSARRGVSSGRYAARSNGTERRAAEVCSDDAAQLTDWPIERISEIVQPTAAQRPALDELRAASAKAMEMLKSGCPKDLPSIPTGRLAAMESR